MMLFRGFYFYLKAVLGHLSESPRENVGDILKNVRENFENHGAFSLFGGVFWENVGEKVLKSLMNSAISSNVGVKPNYLKL